MTRSLAKALKFKNTYSSSDSEDESSTLIDHQGNGEDSVSRSRDKATKKTTDTQLKKSSTVYHTSGHHGKVHKFKNNEPSSYGKDGSPALIDQGNNTKFTIDNQFIVSRSLGKAPTKTTDTKPKRTSTLNHTSGSHGKVHKFKNNEPSSDGNDKGLAPVDEKSNVEDSMTQSPKETTNPPPEKPSTGNIMSRSSADGYYQAPPVAIHSACIGMQTHGSAKAGNYIYYRQGPDNRKIGNYVEQGNSYMGDMYL